MASPNYTLPSWLQTHPDDVANKFVSGLQIGASLGEARNRLQQSANQFAVEADQKQQQINASALKEAQELEVQKAYQGQQVALKQQQLKAVEEKVGLETVKAARQFQAQQQYQKDFQAGVDSGLSEDEAARSSLFKNLSMFGTGAGAGSAAMRAVSAPRDTALKLQNVGGQDFAVGSGGRFQAIKAPASVTDAGKFQAAPLTDTTGKVIPGKYTVPGPGGSRKVISTSTKNPHAEAIKSLEGGPFGLWLTTGRTPAKPTPEYQAAKQQYDSLKAGGSTSTAPATAVATSAERVKVRSPDGSTGTIPKSQLDDALDAGYEQVD